MFVKCRPKIVKEEPSEELVFPSYDTTYYPYYALLHGLSNIDADGIAVDDEVISFVVTTQQANTLTYTNGAWLWKGDIGKSSTWLSKDGRTWVQVRDNVSKYGYTHIRRTGDYTTKASVLIVDNITPSTGESI